MMLANRFLGMNTVADWIEDPHPANEDRYAGLKWVGESLTELQIDPERLIIPGMSAGGGLAASLALLVRDRGGLAICAQLLMCLMLDDRDETVSSKQYISEGTWSRKSGIFG